MCPYRLTIAIPLAGAKAFTRKSLCRGPATGCGALFKPDALLQESAFALVSVKSAVWTLSLSRISIRDLHVCGRRSADGLKARLCCTTQELRHCFPDCPESWQH